MTAIVSDFAKRPETAALISPDKLPNNIGEAFFDEQKRGRADVLIIEEDDNEQEEIMETRSKTNPRYMAMSEREDYGLIKP